jgi:aminopeptidase N
MLWSNVTDGEMSVKEFADIWLREFPKETDPQNLVALSEYAVDNGFDAPSILMYYPRGRSFDTWKKNVDQMLWTEIEKAKPGQERQRDLVDTFISLASQPDSLKKLAAMLDGTLKLPHYEFDQDRRWLAIKCLARNDFEDAGQRIDEELKQDPSSTGEIAALAARVSVPSMNIKKSSFESITSDTGEWSFTQRKAAMHNLFPVQQLELRNQLASNFYSRLDQFVGPDPKSDFFLKNFMWLAPLDSNSTKDAKVFLAQHTGLPDVVRRGLRELVEFGGKYEKALAKAGAEREPAQDQE